MSNGELTLIAAGIAVPILLTVVGVLDRRRRARDGHKSVTSGILGTVDEVFHPEAHHAAEIREVQLELPQEEPGLGEPDWIRVGRDRRQN